VSYRAGPNGDKAENQVSAVISEGTRTVNRTGLVPVPDEIPEIHTED